MTNEMTEERLAYHHQIRARTREWSQRVGGFDDVWIDHAEAVDEIDRLRAELAARDAEVERLITAVILAEDFVQRAGHARNDGTRGGILLETIDKALGRDAVSPEPASCTDYSEVDGNGCILPSGHDGNHRLNPEPAS